jgi:hypothetical protein
MLAHSMTNIQKYFEKDKSDMTIEAMKQALEALEKCMYPQLKQLNAITALRTAIGTAEKQEPVAWAEEIIEDLHTLFSTEMIKEIDSGDALIRLDAAVCAVEEAEQRHTTPPAAQRQPLTDEQINTLRQQYGVTSDGRGIKEFTYVVDFVRAIEAAHGIGEKK